MTEEYRAFLGHIANMVAIYRDMEQALKNHKEAINQAVTDGLKTLEGEAQKTAATILYWQYKEWVRSGSIGDAVGIGAHAVSQYVYKGYVQASCKRCGTPVSIKIESRSSGVRTPYWGVFCPNCDKQRREEDRLEYEQNKSAREAALYALRIMPYPEYLKTEHWAEVRRRALKRASFKCQVCNTSNVSLHVHHRTYENRGQETNADVIVLCAECHRTFHENGTLSKPTPAGKQTD